MSDDHSDTCGYRLEIGVIDEYFSADRCERPVWEDHDRCVWHAPVDGKTFEMLETAQPETEDNFNGAYLREAELFNVDWFADASLVGITLSSANIKGADMTGADMTLATLTDVNALNTDFSGANLEGAILTNADLRRATLEDARLHETVLTDVHVGGGTNMGEVTIYDRDGAPPELVDELPLAAAAWVYRQLQELYRNNGLATLARKSYYYNKDAQRRLAWKRHNYLEAIKGELSRWIMRYGDSPYRVLVTSVVVILAFTAIFPLVGGIQETQGGQSLTFQLENPEDAPQWWIARVLFKSLYFSVVTFATLGYGDIQPIGSLARFLAGIESLLGALLAALLVFVLTRIVTW